MAVDSISLLAQQSYSEIQNRPKINMQSGVNETPMTRAASFHNMVDKQFNSFANLSSSQILDRIQQARNPSAVSYAASANGNISGTVGTAFKALHNTVAKQESAVRRSLIGEASLIDILTATTEAKNVMDTTVRVRDKFLEAFDKVMNMAM